MLQELKSSARERLKGSAEAASESESDCSDMPELVSSPRAQPSPPEPSPAQDSSSSDLENDDAVDELSKTHVVPFVENGRVTVEVEDATVFTCNMLTLVNSDSRVCV